MTTKHPVQPILLALPVVAFAGTVLALAAHARTGDDVWYQRALFADLAGLVVAMLTTVAGVLDTSTLPRFTVARSASLRQVGFDTLGLVLFAATSTALVARVAGHATGDILPLALASLGLVATAVAAWYGRTVHLALERGQTTVWYPSHMLARMPARPRPPGSTRTIV